MLPNDYEDLNFTQSLGLDSKDCEKLDRRIHSIINLNLV